MASVYKRNGKYVASYKGADGRWKAKVVGTDKAAGLQIANALETQAKFRREGLIDPKVDAIAAAERKSIAEHLDEFKQEILARKGNEGYAKQTHQRAERVLPFAKVNRLSEINPSAVSTAVKQLRDGDGGDKSGHSKASIAHHVRAVKMFSRWLHRNGRTRDDALLAVKVGGSIAKSERVHVRRALTREEFIELVTTTAASCKRYGMTGPDRAMLYRLAAGTGFRQNELRSLKLDCFDANGDEPAITVRAAYSKRRRDDRQPITADLAATLAPWLKNLPKGEPIFKLPHRTNIASMIRDDLAEARERWIASAQGAEREKREKSDTLAYASAGGAVCDFHALRHSYVTWLVASGASVSVCQSLARHSTPLLTLGVYSHPTLADQSRALAGLPAGELPKPKPEAAKATGTFDATTQSDVIGAERALKTSGILGNNKASAGTLKISDGENAGDAENRMEIEKDAVDIECPGRGSNPYGPFRPQDFKSYAYTNFATRARAVGRGGGDCDADAEPVIWPEEVYVLMALLAILLKRVDALLSASQRKERSQTCAEPERKWPRHARPGHREETP